MKSLQVDLTNEIKFKFANKVKFYDLTIQNVICTLVQKFNDGDFDEMFNIPKDQEDV